MNEKIYLAMCHINYVYENEHLGYFLTILEGFALGSTVQSKTKGIWIWARRHPTDANKYLILLDTEGLGDVEKVIVMFILHYCVDFSETLKLKHDQFSNCLRTINVLTSLLNLSAI